MTPLRAPGKSITLKPARPNLGVAAGYQKQLDAMIHAMHKSLSHWIIAKYRANEPENMAADASPAMEMRKLMSKLGRRWMKAFDQGADDLANWFARKSFDATDAQLKSVLKKAGFSVPFKMTPGMNDAFQATVSENVGLIKSIASRHLSEVETLVAQSVARGRDLGSLRDELTARYGVTKRRAALIARDQNNKATAVIDRARKMSLGITQAKWVHSGGGKEPRQSHVDANGEVYDVAKGCLIDGEYIMPGEKINCRCVSRAVIPGWDDE